MRENETRPNADELTHRLRADLAARRITLDQMADRLKADAERPIDLDMVRTFCDAYEQRLCAYSAMLQTIVEIATDQRAPGARRWRETEVDEHVDRMMGEPPLWQEQLRTVHEFLVELRGESGRGPVRLNDVSHCTAHMLAAHVMNIAAQAWQSCKDIARRSCTDHRYLYATSASGLFFHAHMPNLPKPNDLMALLHLERAAAMQALRERQTAQPTRAADAGRGAAIQTEAVNVTGQSVSIAADQITIPAGLLRQARANRGKTGAEKWRQARDKLMERWRQGTLPRSLRDAAKTIGETYDTTRRAAHNSDALRTHFNLRDETGDEGRGSLLDELARQADRRIQETIAQMTPRQRRDAEDALRRMQPAQRTELLRTLAADPDAGSVGDVSLIENADLDSRTEDDESG